MRSITWLGQTIDNPCMAACDKVYGATSAKPDPAALIACFVTQCAGSQSSPPTVVPPPGFTLPAGLTFPPGFTIPAGWTIPQGTPLPGGNLPGGSFPPWWPFSTAPGTPSIIPPGLVLPAPWTMPPGGWTLPGPLTLPVPLTVPPGVPVPPNLPNVPAPTPQPTLPPAQVATEKKSDNTGLLVVAGVAAVAVVALIASSAKSIGGGMLENPKAPRGPKSGFGRERTQTRTQSDSGRARACTSSVRRETQPKVAHGTHAQRR